MRYLAGAAVAALVLTATPCYAWNNTTSGSGPQQINDTVPGAQAVSRSHARGGAGGAGGAGGVGGAATVNVYGSAGAPSPAATGATAGLGDPSGGSRYGSRPWFDPTYPVASAFAPPMTSYNSCAGSPTSGAAQFAPFGLSFGTGGGFDNACRLHMLGQDRAAVAYLCRVNGDVRQAFRDIGQPCPQDAPPVTQQVTSYPPDWCGTRNAGDRNQHLECDRTIQATMRR